jgi:hypothetical protein
MIMTSRQSIKRLTIRRRRDRRLYRGRLHTLLCLLGAFAICIVSGCATDRSQSASKPMAIHQQPPAPSTSSATDECEMDVRIVRSPEQPQADDRVEHYVGNRPPLLPSPLLKLPVGAIEPTGWLRTQLELQAEGFVGHLPEISTFCRDDSGWLGASATGWEEVPYWLKGFANVGYLLEDERIRTEAKRWIEAYLASQDEDGWLGPPANKTTDDAWPNMIMLYVLRSWYEETGDERVLPAMSRYLRYRFELPPEKLFPARWGEGKYNARWWQHVRAGDELDSVYWLYNHTGETWLLELGEKIAKYWAPWDERVCSWHGVNICEGFRNPAIYYQQAKDPDLLQAVERNYKEVYDLYGQVPGGMFGADENCRKGYSGPRQAAETCSMVEMMHSCELLLKITGDPKYADRCEDIAFNSLPASMTPDLKGLHYLTSPNMVQIDRESKSPGLQNGGTMLAYSPWRYRCCQHNVAFGWPYFTEHLWMATPTGGLAAVMYAPSQVTARVGPGKGVEVTIIEETDYPFGAGPDSAFREEIRFRVQTSEPVKFPITLRVPEWSVLCKIRITNPAQQRARARAWDEDDYVIYGSKDYPGNEAGAADLPFGPLITVTDETVLEQDAKPATGDVLRRNGKDIRYVPTQSPGEAGSRYVVLDRTWQDGDEIVLTAHTTVAIKKWKTNHNTVSLRCGPLWYSLKIKERWERYLDTDRVPEGDHEHWPAYEVYEDSPWNYGLALTPQPLLAMKRIPGPLPAQPFDAEAAPIKLVTRGQRIDAWQLDRFGLVGEVQPSPAHVEKLETEYITLIPMGCARLRITAFPTVSADEDAHVWTPPPAIPHEASHEHDDIRALSDGTWPKASNDHSIPRFTWWSHKGTTEWVTFTFETPQTLSETHVYWFDDTGVGYCRVPAAWKLYYRDEVGAWQPVRNAQGGGIEPDKFNELSFEEVTTDALKLEVQLQEGFSGGILEWIPGPWIPQ